MKGDISFPDDFMWGTAEDAYQHEGGNYNNDWYRWERQEPSPVPGGDRLGSGPDFYNRYEEDFRRAASAGHTIHRIGVEWSRIEPESGVIDHAAVQHYREMLSSLKSKGFTVILNIWHFTLPIWASDVGGFESDYILKEKWPSFVRLCCESFASVVDMWSTVIDAQIYALRGYAQGDMPPLRSGTFLALRMYSRMIRLHNIAYDVIKDSLGDEAPVGQIYFFFDYYPASRSLRDRAACRFIDWLFNWKMLRKIYSGDRLDWLGINYYTRQIVKFDPRKPGFIAQDRGEDLPASDMDWEIFPDGLGRICRRIAGFFPGLPLHITECGIADAEDRLRPEFIRSHVEMTSDLIGEGLPVKSFSYWSSLDNWEWTEGWGPKYGLCGWDPDTGKRIPRKSAELYRSIVINNGLKMEE